MLCILAIRCITKYRAAIYCNYIIQLVDFIEWFRWRLCWPGPSFVTHPTSYRLCILQNKTEVAMTTVTWWRVGGTHNAMCLTWQSAGNNWQLATDWEELKIRTWWSNNESRQYNGPYYYISTTSLRHHCFERIANQWWSNEPTNVRSSAGRLSLQPIRCFEMSKLIIHVCHPGRAIITNSLVVGGLAIPPCCQTDVKRSANDDCAVDIVHYRLTMEHPAGDLLTSTHWLYDILLAGGRCLPSTHALHHYLLRTSLPNKN